MTMKKYLLLLLIICCTYGSTAQKNNRIVIRGFIDNPKIVDSISMVIWKNYYNPQKRYVQPYKLVKLRLNNPSGYFEFKDTIYGPVYFTIGQKYNHFNNLDDGILKEYIGEPGDSITIFNFGSKNSFFYGPGKEKYECRFFLDRNTMYSVKSSFDTTAQFWALNQFKSKLSPFIYEVLYLDIIGKLSSKKLQTLANTYKENNDLFKKVMYSCEQDLQMMEKISEKAKLFSATYCSFKAGYINFKSKLREDKKSTYAIIKEMPQSLIKEKLMTSYLFSYVESLQNIDSLIDDALSFVRFQDYRDELTSIQASHAKGTQAYNFSLPDEKGIIRTLHEFQGKVVFLDFWYTGCKACIVYHETVLKPIIHAYRDNTNIVFLTVNIDDTRERWLASVKGGEYTSPESINLYTNGEAGNHPIINRYKINSYPRPILIDKQGKIISTSNFDLRLDSKRVRQTIEDALLK